MSIKYTEGLKRPNQEIEFTPERIIELNKCYEDVWQFLPYVKIVHPDKGIINYEPYDFQKTILKNLQNHRFNVILASRQSGKCVHPETIISIRNKKTGEVIIDTIENIFNKNK